MWDLLNFFLQLCIGWSQLFGFIFNCHLLWLEIRHCLVEKLNFGYKDVLGLFGPVQNQIQLLFGFGNLSIHLILECFYLLSVLFFLNLEWLIESGLFWVMFLKKSSGVIIQRLNYMLEWCNLLWWLIVNSCKGGNRW